MEALQYLDFDLEIGPGSGGDYPVAVRLPAGIVRSVMHFPFDKQALELSLHKLEIGLLRSRAGRRQVLQPQEETIRDFGIALFDALFAGDVRAIYDQQRARAKQQEKGVRIRLLVEAPDLATLPWEYLRDARQADFLCLSPHTPLVRYVKIPQPLEPLKVQPPLRILGMIASPSDQDALDVEGEKRRLITALQPLEAQGMVKLHWVQGQTWQDLQEALWNSSWHVFHFIGHGAFSAKTDEGLLALADQEGKTFLLPGPQFGRLMANAKARPRLVVLNACEGAKGSEHDLFSSTGAALVRREIPAVVAMQAEFSDDAALVFTSTFYKALAHGFPVDAALAEARTAIWISIPQTLEWGTPVLYLRAPDGVLFEIEQGAPALAQSSSKQSSKTKEQWLEEGIKLEGDRRFDEALAAYDQAIQLDRSYARAYRRKGFLLNHLKRYNASLETLEQAIILEPQDARHYLFKGDALRMTGRSDEALNAYEQAIKRNQKLGAAYIGKGDIYRERDHYQEALAAYEQALLLNPGDVSAIQGRMLTKGALSTKPVPKTKEQWLEEGKRLEGEKRFEEALEAYKKAIQLGGRYASAFRHKGYLLMSQFRDYLPALQDFEQAILLDPENARPYLWKGDVKRVNGDYNEALAAYDEAIQRAQDKEVLAAAHTGKGDVYRKLYLNTEALAAYKQALVLDPTDQRALSGKLIVEPLVKEPPVFPLYGVSTPPLEPPTEPPQYSPPPTGPQGFGPPTQPVIENKDSKPSRWWGRRRNQQ
jgi:tetratricopeptide (TPR) repeat protein